MAFGYAGRIAHVDLTTAQVTIEETTELFRRQYMGGWGYIGYYLLREVPRHADPLGPENVLVFATGPVTGVPTPGAGRSAVGAKSPLTGGFGASEAGGWFGAELTSAGFDAIVIKGQARGPVYLWVHDGAIEIRPASHLWGKLTAEAQALIRQELGDSRIRTAQIGPAGERLARIACIIHDVNRAAGRCGLGAVMGAKRLKAVAVRGSGRKEVSDAEALREHARWYQGHYQSTWAAQLHDTGTDGGLISQNEAGGLPTRNFREGCFEHFEALSGERMRDTILKDRDTCFGCPVRCKRVVAVADGRYNVDPAYGGPEYETVAALGSNCGVGDLAAVALANQLCNAYGLDTISTGVAISWAMECFERGLLAPADTGGLSLRFGDAEAMLEAVRLIGEREGFGRLLGEGSLRAAQAIGRGSERYAMQVRGQEIPMHEPRVKFGLGLGYALSPTGADHNHNFHDSDYQDESGIAPLRPFGILEPLPYSDLSPRKVRLAAVEILWNTLCNVLGMCAFVMSTIPRQRIVPLVQAITGWDTSLYELLKAAERAYAMGRYFTAREGLDAEQDRLPERFFEPFASGPSAGNRLPPEQFAQARSLLYRMWGWDEQTGAPTAWKLHELGLGWLAEAAAH